MRHITRLVPLSLALTLVAACQDSTSPFEPGGISALLSDGAHGGNPDFFFLPPLAGDPSSSPYFEPGKFNGRLRPVMAVFKGSDQCRLSNTKKKVYGPTVVPVSLTEEMYQIGWNTDNLRAGTIYRLCIFGSAAGKWLGFVDLTPVSGGLKNVQTGEIIKFQQGRTVPVKFRIERGALSYDPTNPDAVGTEFTVDKTGGSVTLASETGDTLLAAVSVPTNAVAQGDVVTIVVTTEEPKFAGKCLPDAPNQSNWCYEIHSEPALYQFGSLVRVEICVDPEPVAPALRDVLRVHKYNTTQGLQELPWADPTLIGNDCTGSGLGLNGAASQGAAVGVLDRVARWAGRLLAPREAHAAESVALTPPKGIGGLSGSFSDYGGAASFCASVTELSSPECEALEALYDATNGPNWTDHSGWLQTTTPCSTPWYGVVCSSGSVFGLLLGRNNLTGTLPPQLGDLQNIQLLALYGDSLSGPIPTTLGNLGHLYYLDLQQNQLSGQIPLELGTATSLTQLYLNSNQLSGPVPDTLGNLSRLQVLRLDENQLTGSLPEALGNLSDLEALDLASNSLSGTVPLAVAQMGGRLEFAHPGGCQFTPGNDLFLGDAPEYRAADLDGDGYVCTLPLVPLSFTSVRTGYEFSCGLTAAGTAFCWGWNQSGQLGNGDTTSRLTPGAVLMPAGKTFASITLGGAHACGLTGSGEAYCWGENNSYGQVGDGTRINRLEPVAVHSDGLTFTSITAGGAHTCGLTSGGQAYCWGYNLNGQVGDNSTTDRWTPVMVAQPPGVTFDSITAGGEHTCGLTAANQAYCWGWDEFGQLGDGDTTDQHAPVTVSGDYLFATLTAGGVHTCGKTRGGATYCWGTGLHGELGNGGTDNSSIPVSVVMPSGVDSLTPTAGGNHTCGLTYLGAAYCWGSDFYGQVGHGTTTDYSTPVTVLAPSGVTFASLVLGIYQSCGLTPTGAAYCWGDNWSGKLGDGTTTNRSAPVAVR